MVTYEHIPVTIPVGIERRWSGVPSYVGPIERIALAERPFREGGCVGRARVLIVLNSPFASDENIKITVVVDIDGGVGGIFSHVYPVEWIARVVPPREGGHGDRARVLEIPHLTILEPKKHVYITISIHVYRGGPNCLIV